MPERSLGQQLPGSVDRLAPMMADLVSDQDHEPPGGEQPAAGDDEDHVDRPQHEHLAPRTRMAATRSGHEHRSPPVRHAVGVRSGRMPRDVAHAIFDVYVRTGEVVVERAGPWPDEVALVDEQYVGDAVEWVLTAVCQDWDAMPSDLQLSLGCETYSVGSMVLRHAGDGFDPFNRPLRPYARRR
jgi:hypothetical protein